MHILEILDTYGYSCWRWKINKQTVRIYPTKYHEWKEDSTTIRNKSKHKALGAI